MAIDKRPESLLSILKSGGEFALIVCAITGISVEIFREEGLLKKSLEKLVENALATSIVSILGIVLLLLIAKILHDRIFSSAENTHAFGNFLMKGMMILGAYFLFHFLTSGTF